jgi:restriction system protein
VTALHLGWLLAAGGATTTPDVAHVLRDSLHPLREMLGKLLVGLWPLWVVVAVGAAGRFAAYLWRMRRLQRAGMLEIRGMTGTQFEQKLAVTFRALGYHAEVVGRRGDFGADLVMEKDGIRTVVQAKRYEGRVGVKAVQEVVAAKPMYDADDAMVVTNARFTKAARELGRKNDVTLWDHDDLTAALLRGQMARKKKAPPARAFERKPVEPLPPVAMAPGSAPEAATVAGQAPTAVTSPSGAFCARCGGPVSVKVRDYCLSHTKGFGGLVYCFEHQRDFRSGG